MAKIKKRPAEAADAVEEDGEESDEGQEEKPKASSMKKLRKAKACDLQASAGPEAGRGKGRGRGRARGTSGRGRACRGRGRGRGKTADDWSRESTWDGEDSKQAFLDEPVTLQDESEHITTSEAEQDEPVKRKPAARVSKAKAKPGPKEPDSKIMDDMNDAEAENDRLEVDALTGRQTFAGRRQPANGMANLKWAVLRKCFIDHVYPHIHVNRSKHEDGPFNLVSVFFLDMQLASLLCLPLLKDAKPGTARNPF